MLIQLSLASLMVLFTVAVHLLGLSILIRLFRSDHQLSAGAADDARDP